MTWEMKGGGRMNLSHKFKQKIGNQLQEESTKRDRRPGREGKEALLVECMMERTTVLFCWNSWMCCMKRRRGDWLKNLTLTLLCGGHRLMRDDSNCDESRELSLTKA
jgi:hypothetical protein